VILLDTHVVIWLLKAPERPSGRARQAIVRARLAGEKVGCSPVSLYEIANSLRLKRLHLYSPTLEFFAAVQAEVEFVLLTADIAICAAGLPASFHGDPD
jgi:PIN domain nuclease of toxin-antitoxin system